MNIFELALPLFNRVKEINESLFYKKTYNVNNETLSFGTREKDFYSLELNELKSGKKFTVKNYLLLKLKELDELVLGANNMEKLTGDKLYSLYNRILDSKNIIKYELEKVDSAKSIIVRKNTSKHLTFCWLGKPVELTKGKKYVKKDQVLFLEEWIDRNSHIIKNMKKKGEKDLSGYEIEEFANLQVEIGQNLDEPKTKSILEILRELES